MKNYVLCGMMYGDEGKGSFTDYLTFENKATQMIRYNGGAQASHTVVTEDNIIHKFSQLGSGMFYQKAKTILTENMVVDPANLITEIEIFAKKVNTSKEQILNRIHINENAYIVTPYHKLINKLRELSSLYVRRGTVGTGVSEVPYLLKNEDLGIQIKHLLDSSITKEKLLDLFHYTRKFLKENKPYIDEQLFKQLIKEEDIYYLTELEDRTQIINYYSHFLDNHHLNLYHSFPEVYKGNQNTVFESSQGLLIDGKFGLLPNTTHLDTTNHYAKELIHDPMINIGLIGAFSSRHGIGVFPTEDNLPITDKNQEHTYWNGQVRFGWFDAVLARYSQKINKVDEIYISALDKLNDFKTLKVCNSYTYYGIIDDTFHNNFEYKMTDGKIIITNIKNNDNITNYLSKCIPNYIEIKGWQKDIKLDDIPPKCMAYIHLIEELINIKATLISIGPTRKDKVKLK